MFGFVEPPDDRELMDGDAAEAAVDRWGVDPVWCIDNDDGGACFCVGCCLCGRL